jgi:hypothetical protein
MHTHTHDTNMHTHTRWRQLVRTGFEAIVDPIVAAGGDPDQFRAGVEGDHEGAAPPTPRVLSVKGRHLGLQVVVSVVAVRVVDGLHHELGLAPLRQPLLGFKLGSERH